MFGASNHEIYPLRYYDVLSILNLLSRINQALLHSSSKLNQEISKKLLQYLSGIVTSMFKKSTGGCAGQFASPEFPD